MIKTVEGIMSTIKDNEIVVTSTGMPSRVVYHVKDRPLNFYTVGSMSSSLPISIGLALNTKRMVNVIAGDGDILMSLGTLVLMNKLKLKNLRLFILDNGCYASTGCQKTCSDAVDFTSICDCFVYKIPAEKLDVGRIKLTPKEIRKRFENALRSK